jgi:hypothetical protein
MAETCQNCDFARFVAVRGKVGCALLNSMDGTPAFSLLGRELSGLWRGKVHPESYPDAKPAPTSGFEERSVVVAATDRCSRYKPR